MTDLVKLLCDHAWSDGMERRKVPSAHTEVVEAQVRAIVDEYNETMRIAQAVAAMHIWMSIQSFFGVPIFAYKSDGTYTIWRHS